MAPSDENSRTFNLDIAKFLCVKPFFFILIFLPVFTSHGYSLQFAAIVDRREHGTIVDTIRAVASSTPPSTPIKIMSAAAASAARARRSPSAMHLSSGSNAVIAAPTPVAPAGRLAREIFTPERAQYIEETYARTFAARNTHARSYGFGSVEREGTREEESDAAISVACYRLEVEYEPVSELGCVGSVSFFVSPLLVWSVFCF